MRSMVAHRYHAAALRAPPISNLENHNDEKNDGKDQMERNTQHNRSISQTVDTERPSSAARERARLRTRYTWNGSWEESHFPMTFCTSSSAAFTTASMCTLNLSIDNEPLPSSFPES